MPDEMKVPATPKTIGGILPWFGSKRTMASVIVGELGDHHTYFEPFCGSMAVLLAKPTARMETVNDLHADLINVARCIRDRAAAMQFYRRCRRMLMVEELHNEAALRWKLRRGDPMPEKPDVDRAVDFFFSSWVGRNGLTGTQLHHQCFAARYTPRGGDSATRWINSVGSIPQWRRRMRGLTILNRDGFELVEKLEDAPGMAMYVDPPYVVKGASYVHDFQPEDHARLAGILVRFKRARVVVSYYEHPILAELYPGWTVRKCPQTKAMASGSGRVKGAVVAPEILILNGPSYAAMQGSMFT